MEEIEALHTAKAVLSSLAVRSSNHRFVEDCARVDRITYRASPPLSDYSCPGFTLLMLLSVPFREVA